MAGGVARAGAVVTAIGQLAAGRTREQVLADLPDLEREGIPRATSFMLCVPPIR